MTDEDTTRLERSQQSGQWTVNSLHDHLSEVLDQMERRLDDRFEAQERATTTAMVAAEKAVNAALAAAEKAVLKAETLATQRAEQQNEWRGTVTDLMSLMMPRAEYESSHSELVRQLMALTTRMDLSTGSDAGERLTMGKLYAAIAGAASLVGIIVVAVGQVVKS